MKLVKLALISVVGLSFVIFLISLLIPSHIRVSRAIDIKAPKEKVVKQLSDLRQWEHWNAVVNNPGVQQPRFTATSFKSEMATVTLEGVKTDTVFTKWTQQGGDNIQSAFTLYEQQGTVVVQWYFDFHQSWYPWEKFGSIVFDKQLGPPMELSLKSLKKLAEENP